VTPHPLDPLSADEIRLAAGALRRDQGVGERWRFASIELREPPKREAISRQAEVICWNRDDGTVYKARVDVAGDRVLAWDEQPDGQPNMTVDEFKECDEALRRDPRVIVSPFGGSRSSIEAKRQRSPTPWSRRRTAAAWRISSALSGSRG
jgi:primary-amine oxidase